MLKRMRKAILYPAAVVLSLLFGLGPPGCKNPAVGSLDSGLPDGGADAQVVPDAGGPDAALPDAQVEGHQADQAFTSGGISTESSGYRLQLYVAPVRPVGSVTSSNYRLHLGPASNRRR